MKVSIINVGHEVLQGDVLNTNAHFLSVELSNLGYDVITQSVCKDDQQDLVDLLEFVSKKSEIIILTGGLGPTKDDLTKEVLCDFLKRKLKPSPKVLKNIEEKFKSFNKEMTENNKKQALIIDGAKVLMNEKGTAPGFIVKDQNKSYILLPGPPREMKYLYEKYVMTYLSSIQHGNIESCVIKLSGIGESAVESKLNDIYRPSEVYVGTYASLGEVKIKLTITDEKMREALDLLKEKIYEGFSNYIVSHSNQETYHQVCEHLIDKSISISTAESCTGGLLSSKIVEHSGISSIYPGSFITYSNDLKMRILKVNENSLIQNGAVSEVVVKEMIEGLYQITKTDICVAISGIAGPNGGTEEKPVGLVYIGIKIFDDLIIDRKIYRGNRNEVREQSVKKVFDIISQKLIIDN